MLHAPRTLINRFRQIVNAFPDGWLSSGQISREGTALLRCASIPSLIDLGPSECHEEEIRERGHGRRDMTYGPSPACSTLSSFDLRFPFGCPLVGPLYAHLILSSVCLFLFDGLLCTPLVLLVHYV